jgi:hypothetical protein
MAMSRTRYSDATVLERSELVVVGHIKTNSIQYVAHEPIAGPDGHMSRSWHHTATLVVTEVIKGKFDEAEIPIVIHYGLDPTVGGNLLRENATHDSGGSRPGYSKDRIEIFDSKMCSGQSLVADAAQDNVWFLRRREGAYGEKPLPGLLGIVDPEDVQPLEVKPYFLCYLSQDPEAAVKNYGETHPDLGERVQTYLDHREIQRILKSSDPPEQRARALMPYYLKYASWDSVSEARPGLVACGPAAGPVLMEVFKDPGQVGRKEDIIRIWGSIGYKEATSVLIGVLKDGKAFFGEQDLQPNWWNSDPDPARHRQRRLVYGQVHSAVAALRDFADPRAREAVKKTAERLETLPSESREIVEACEAVLKAFDARP